MLIDTPSYTTRCECYRRGLSTSPDRNGKASQNLNHMPILTPLTQLGYRHGRTRLMLKMVAVGGAFNSIRTLPRRLFCFPPTFVVGIPNAPDNVS